MENAQKFGDLIVSMTDRDDNIDESVDNLITNFKCFDGIIKTIM
jgi:hypothetical protein